MLKKLVIPVLIGFSFSAMAQKSEWKAVDGHIKTVWADSLDTKNPLPEYPRPQLKRDHNWMSLNGLWDYSISSLNQTPSINSGKILVPFAVESSLSGVGKTVGKDSLLWYKRSFTLLPSMRGKKMLIHFGAVDWRTTVYINGKEVGMHEGGNDPFSFDITSYLKGNRAQQLVVKVWDPTNEGPQPRGKQVIKPGGIWYTPVTGMWQTVWLESVNKSYIKDIKITPDIDAENVAISANVEGSQANQQIKISAWDGANKVAEAMVNASEKGVLNVKNPKLWDTKSPFLYDLKVELIANGKAIDKVDSYFAMRKISMAKDENGVQRMMLNNKFVFQYGPLDQGWWPDGLYTAPTDNALKFDIDKTKEMGFNMIRKHIKVEPARWYYYCDKEGMLVWQDMPSGDLGNNWENRPGIVDKQTERDRTPESEAIYRKEWTAIMDALYNYPSIVVWTPFNEAWGQFKTVEITEWTKRKDSSRLINSASGGNFFLTGDMIDLHNYPQPAMPDPAVYGDKRAIVLGEFGGLGLPIENHVWQKDKNWGYRSFKNETELFAKYSEFIKRLEELKALGLSAAVYTQTTDVEVETNGLMTYDRKVIKFPVKEIKSLHEGLYK